MRKQRIKHYLKLGILLFGMSLLLENCESNEEPINLDFENSENLNLKTVSFQDAKNFFNVKIKQVKEERKFYARTDGQPHLELTPDWNSIDHDDLYGIDQTQLTLADVEVNRKGDYKSNLIFINVNDEIKNAIYTIYEEKVNSDGVVLEARIYLNEIDGTFIDGYEIEDRKFVRRYVKIKKNNVQKASFFSFFFQEESECDWTQCGDVELDGDDGAIISPIPLDEAVVSGTAGNTDSKTAGLYSIIRSWNLDGASGYKNRSGSTGGGYSGIVGSIYGNSVDTEDIPEDEDKDPCPKGYVKDSTNKCVKKPCTGDPVLNPEIAPQTNSGIEGGMHDTCARKNKNTTCKGVRGRKWHNGVDLKNPLGAPIYAIYDGNATKHTQRDSKTGKLDGAGYYVAIESNVNGKTVRLVFFHLEENTRVTGNVKAGDIIGYQGDSGNLKNGIDQGYAISHVHIKAQENGANIDPLKHLKTKIDLTTGQVINPCN